MKLIVGLGNPGKTYTDTWHNLGFWVVEKLAYDAAKHQNWNKFSHLSLTFKLKLEHTEVVLVKPQTFMNESGASVREVAAFYKISPENIWVVHDELDLPPDTVRISFNSAAAGHKGVESIIAQLDTKGFWRFRLGIGRPQGPLTPETYVLKHYSADERLKIAAPLVLSASTLIREALAQGIAKVPKTSKVKTA